MAKKKKGAPKKIRVKPSKPHRRKASWVRGHWRNRTKNAHRNKGYNRNPRRTNEEIKQKGTRKQERAKKKAEKREKQKKQALTKAKKQKKQTKTKQTKLGPPRTHETRRSLLKAK